MLIQSHDITRQTTNISTGVSWSLSSLSYIILKGLLFKSLRVVVLVLMCGVREIMNTTSTNKFHGKRVILSYVNDEGFTTPIHRKAY